MHKFDQNSISRELYDSMLLAMVEHLPSGVTIVDGDLRMIAWNDLFMELLEFPESIIAAGPPKLEDFLRYNAERGEYGPGDPDVLVADRLALARQRLPHVFERRRPNGTVIEVRGQPLPGGGFITIYTDVTDRVMAAERLREGVEKALRESEDTFTSAFRFSPTPLSLSEVPSRRYVDVNDAWVAATGYRRDEALGRTPIELALFESWPASLHHLERVGAQGGGQSDVEVRRKDGSVGVFLVSGCLVNMRGKPMVILSAVDISHQRRIEFEIRALNETLEQRVRERTQELAVALEKLTQAKDELVNAEKMAGLGAIVVGVAHELNTPLGNCMMTVTALRDRLVEVENEFHAGKVTRTTFQELLEWGRDAADLLLRNVERSANLVGSFKQIAVDPACEVRSRFDLAEHLGRVVAEMSQPTVPPRLTIDLNIAPGIDMDSYPEPLAQVVQHLVNNVRLHACAGRERGRVLIGAMRRGEDAVEIWVDDDGEGIPPELRRRVFDPFYTTRLGQGSGGLGLYVVYNLATTVLGGSIEISDAPLGGARFRFLLPRVISRRP